MTVRRRANNLTDRLAAESHAEKKAEAIRGLGMEIPRPRYELPMIPEDPTELQDSELMRLMNQLGKWAGYLGYELAKAQVEERFAEAKAEKLAARVQIRNKGGSVSAMKASVWDDESYAEAKEAENEAYAHRKLVEALYNTADRDGFLVSRELTRRLGRNDRDRRRERYSD